MGHDLEDAASRWRRGRALSTEASDSDRAVEEKSPRGEIAGARDSFSGMTSQLDRDKIGSDLAIEDIEEALRFAAEAVRERASRTGT